MTIHETDLAGFIDLHAHTNASDGSLTPGELIAMACGAGLSAWQLQIMKPSLALKRRAPPRANAIWIWCGE